MQVDNIPVPRLKTAHCGPLYHVEAKILNQVPVIETWFRKKWQETPPPLTASVDLRHGGFKIAPVDTNLFPAGFNNLNPDFIPLCVQAMQSTLQEQFPHCTEILLIPESHTRNLFYLKSFSILKKILVKAGFIVRIGTLNPEIQAPLTVFLDEVKKEQGPWLLLEPIIKKGNKLTLSDFSPCLIILNNDLSSGIPDILQNLEQPILPPVQLGWDTRLKSTHFNFYNAAVAEFSQLIDLDPWLINPLFSAVDGVDFMSGEGVAALADKTDALLQAIREKYALYGVEDEPFVAVKADNGTYGMSVMMVQEGKQLLELNRKQRTRMAAIKGSRKVDRVIVQEGVYTFETMGEGQVAEPVVYMIGQYVVGGFYRVHQSKGIAENLNAPGMHFEPLAFTEPCNSPCDDLDVVECPNRFYAYGVIARLAALAAAREQAALKD